MTDQELAKSLVSKGLLSTAQVQQAAAQRDGRRFGEVVVSLGWVSVMDVIETDPDSADYLQRIPPPGGAPAGNGRPQAQVPNFQAQPAARPQAVLPNQAVPTQVEAVPTQPAQAQPADPNADAAEAMYAMLGQDNDLQMHNDMVIIHGEEERLQGADGVAGTIVSYTNELLRIAVELRASDMHLEPRAQGLVPRYRVDGQLRSGSPIPTDLRAAIISRLKILAELDISEARLPQDGRFRATVGGHIFDFRVSTFPTIHGEKMVLRLLDRSALVTDLRRLGFTDTMRERFETLLQQAQGMILVTGPTGSGKTTTLYAALATTRDETKNVVTVEDPVEYELPGVAQSNVNPDIGLNFATQLRAILRQDPDVILVGEIRDGETADIAIRAALTGHLVLSTLHTNSAVAAITRMMDMGVPAFLISSSLSGVIAQRLVRLICRHCRQPLAQDSPEYEAAIARLSLESGFPLFRGTGCTRCNGTGSRGRIAVLELFEVDRESRRAIMKSTSSAELRDIAIKNGMRTMWQDGLDKLRLGLTTADEIGRVLLGSEEEAEAEA